MDYRSWLSCGPYSWTQDEKERRYLPFFRRLTEHHRRQCPPYARALSAFSRSQKDPFSLAQIPMLPIRLFKLMDLKSISDSDVFKILTSSGTTGQARSRIYLDADTAQNQQLTLCAIVKNFLGAGRLPMLIVDSPSVFTDKTAFNARGAAILGFSIFAKKKWYALTDDLSVNTDSLRAFTENKGPVLIFGFTFMIWKYFCQALAREDLSFDFSNAIVIHGGGWKKMQDQAVSAAAYKQRLRSQFGIRRVHNYYGMAEQTGCIYMECEKGHLHASIFSDILVRNVRDFSPCAIGETGILQVLSPMAFSYPGHSILTEDMGTLLGIDDCPCGRKGKYFRIDGRIPSAEIRGCSDTHE